MRAIWIATALLGSATLAHADLKTRNVTYSYGGVELKGYLAWDDAIKGKRSGVLLVHEWWGLNDYARRRADQLAGLGYVAFACDMYGGGKVTEHPSEAGEMAGAVRRTWKPGRAGPAGLKVLTSNELVDSGKVAAIGYCFGGSTALQLAYTGADLKAVVTFHAALPVPTAEQAKAIKASLAILHGAADPFVKEETIQKVGCGSEQGEGGFTRWSITAGPSTATRCPGWIRSASRA